MRRTGTFEAFERDDDGDRRSLQLSADGSPATAHRGRRAVIGADGASSAVARQAIPAGDRVPYVFAYHEIVRSPPTATAGFDGTRCDVYYRGALSPDFYGWVFPHGDTTSVGTGTARQGILAARCRRRAAHAAGLEASKPSGARARRSRCSPLPRWDNGRDVLLAGDAAGVVAPASGEGIYYAMAGGRLRPMRSTSFLAPAMRARWPRRASASWRTAACSGSSA